MDILDILDIWILGYLDIWIFEYFGYLDIWDFRILGLAELVGFCGIVEIGRRSQRSSLLSLDNNKEKKEN